MLRTLALKYLPDFCLKRIKKIYYVHALRSFSERDEPDLHIVRRLVRPGDYVIDIGANVGWYTKILSELVGNQGRVYSIEPIPPTFELLSYCVSILGLDNVELFQYGVSDRDDKAWMEVPIGPSGENFYRARIIPESKANRECRRYYVSLRTLDSILSERTRPPISFIKCDVEGHEAHVIKGACTVLQDLKPAWLMEVGHDLGKGSELFALLRHFNYHPYWFDGKRLIRWRPGDYSVNCFFLTDKHL